MRIRKRQVPLPLSSLSPVPLSDPLLRNLNYSPPPSAPPMAVVQQLRTHHDDRNPTQPKPPNSNNPVEETVHVGHLLHPQPSDLRLNQDPLSIRAGAPKGWGFSDNQRVQKRDCGLELLELKEEEEDGGGSQEADAIRNESILGAEALLAFASGPSSSSHRALERWHEGETILMDDEKDKRLIRTKKNKKCSTSATQPRENYEAERGVDRVNSVVNGSNASAIRKRARVSGAIMEGSRCSRVNGRGWRCCQQTLVGYSLCEHHLGKGRLRSMTSVRRRSMKTATSTITAASARIEVKRSSTSEEDTVAVLDDRDNGEDKGEEEKIEIKPLMARRRKRRMKLGVVKARSMSSLLGQTKSAVAQVAYLGDENNINK